MKFSIDKIYKVCRKEIITGNIKGDTEYQWIDIVAIPQRPTNLSSNLYLTTHSYGKDGWDDGFDRRPTATNVANDKGWHLVTDGYINVDNTKYLMVKSIDSFSRKLYDYARNNTKPYVIGVTGSVGKTTTVAFLEHLLNTCGKNVTRFYSKRLTPYSVMCHYINRVDQNTSFIVMEYSAYMKDHVAKLSRILPPNITFLTNIYDTHINPGMFKNKKDIYNSKIKIKPSKSIGYINNNILTELNITKPKGWEGFDIETPNFNDNILLPPTIRTAELYTIGKLLTKVLKIPKHKLIDSYRSFKPKEKRILTINYRGKNIFFHGETSGGSRLWSWFETINKEYPWFMIEKIDFANENPNGFINLIEKVFNSNKTIVLDTLQNRRKLPVKATFVDENTFRDILQHKLNGYAVYHKALANRENGFDPQKYINFKW